MNEGVRALFKHASSCYKVVNDWFNRIYNWRQSSSINHASWTGQCCKTFENKFLRLSRQKIFSARPDLRLSNETPKKHNKYANNLRWTIKQLSYHRNLQKLPQSIAQSQRHPEQRKELFNCIKISSNSFKIPETRRAKQAITCWIKRTLGVLEETAKRFSLVATCLSLGWSIEFP